MKKVYFSLGLVMGAFTSGAGYATGYRYFDEAVGNELQGFEGHHETRAPETANRSYFASSSAFCNSAATSAQSRVSASPSSAGSLAKRCASVIRVGGGGFMAASTPGIARPTRERKSDCLGPCWAIGKYTVTPATLPQYSYPSLAQ